MKMLNLSEPVIGKEEQAAVCDVIRSGWLTMGERVSAFENAFAKLHGANGAVAVNSCTAALHLALAVNCVGPGDEVLVPSLTFIATVNAVLYVGAEPIFVDIEGIHRPHLSPTDAALKLSPRTKAVIVMHYGGYVADLPRWRSFCDAHQLVLIEDAAHAPAVAPVGRLSDASTFSFFGNKNMTTAEGGMLLARDPSHLKRAIQLRAHGMSTDTLTRHKGHAYTYQVDMLGYNYRMDELRAAIGLVQLAHLKQWNRKRTELSGIYRHLLQNELDQIRVPFNPADATAAHLMPVILPQWADRSKIMKSLRNDGIQSSIHYPPVHKFTFYQRRYPGISLLKTEQFCKRELSLPLHPAMDGDDVQRVVSSLKSAVSASVAAEERKLPMDNLV